MNISGIFKKVMVTLAVGALSVGALVGVSAPAQAAKSVDNYTLNDRCEISWDTKLSGEILKDLNKYRASKGAKPVKMDYYLLEWSSDWVQTMAKKDYFEHNPNIFAIADYYWEFGQMGENIAYRSPNNASAASFMKGWKNSPAHNKNMLDKKWSAVGIALHKSPKTGLVYGIQMFSQDLPYAIPQQVGTKVCKDHVANQNADKDKSSAQKKAEAKKKADAKKKVEAKKKADFNKAKATYTKAQKAYKAADKTADNTLKTLSKQKKSKSAVKAYKALQKAEKVSRSTNKSVKSLKSKSAFDKQTKALKSKTTDLKKKTKAASKHIKKRR